VIKIGDFGISKELDTVKKLAETSLGTPYSMAPEVWKGQPYADKADIWAFGCTLFELVMFKKPFVGNDVTAVYNAVINHKLEHIPDSVNTDIKMLIIEMLEKDPNERPSIWDISNRPFIH